MESEIKELLQDNPKLKAREIANKINAKKSEVNSFLYDNRNQFEVDENFLWSLASKNSLIINLNSGSWIKGQDLEKTLIRDGSPLESDKSTIIFVIGSKSYLLLEASARILALINQLTEINKEVILDFSNAIPVLHYLNRSGFMQLLPSAVTILPYKPDTEKANEYKGKSDNVMEFDLIDPRKQDENIPARLKEIFVTNSSSAYSSPAFTVISELFGNVYDHSETVMPGFAALQKYGGSRPNIQTVISDSGVGIINKLRPTLSNYPELNEEFGIDTPKNNAALIKAIFELGEISSTGIKGRGLGLKRSGDSVSKFNASISIRQENIDIHLHYKNGQLSTPYYNDKVVKLRGTHICFNFKLD